LKLKMNKFFLDFVKKITFLLKFHF